MQLIRISSRVAAVLAAALFALALASCSAPSTDSAWVGTYKTQDTQGGSMEITLNEDGTASATRGEEKLDGSWKEEGDAVMITWDDQWTTKIAKDGDKYIKTAYKGGSQDGDPVSAEKIK